MPYPPIPTQWVLRLVKGSTLTHWELDENQKSLNTKINDTVGANVGTIPGGQGIYRDKTTNPDDGFLNFRNLVEGPGVTINTIGSDIIISSSGGTAGTGDTHVMNVTYTADTICITLNNGAQWCVNMSGDTPYEYGTAMYSIQPKRDGSFASADYSNIGGGLNNIVSSGGTYSNIAGGDTNIIHGNYGFIGGGKNNLIQSATTYASILNGSGNTITANTQSTTILGGDNLIGTRSHTTFMNGLDTDTDSISGQVPFRYHGVWANQGFGRILMDMTGAGDSQWVSSAIFPLNCDDPCPSSGSGVHQIVEGYHSGCTLYMTDCSGTTLTADTCCVTTGPYAWRGGLDSITTTLPLIGQAGENIIDIRAEYSTIQGGLSNRILSGVTFSSILNGSGNTISSTVTWPSGSGWTGTTNVIGSAIVGSMGRTATLSETTYVTGLDALTDGYDGLKKPFRYHGNWANEGSGKVLREIVGNGDARWIYSPFPVVNTGDTCTNIIMSAFTTGNTLTVIDANGNVYTANTCSIFAGPYEYGSGLDSIQPILDSPFATSNFSSIGGGVSNKVIGVKSRYSRIGGGQNNIINSVGTSSADTASLHSYIGGGDNNTINESAKSAIVGGEDNLITGGTHNHIGSGIKNKIINSNRAALMAGSGNTINLSNNSFVGSGEINLIDKSTRASIVGGRGNTVTASTLSVIGGGLTNKVIVSQSSIIGSGAFNSHLNSDISIIGAGMGNTTTRSTASLIGSGFQNNIVDSQYTSIVGGRDNFVSGGTSNSIGGGRDNKINEHSTHTSISSGKDNIIKDNDYTSIVGGSDNFITGGTHNIIGAGDGNLVINSHRSIIGAGSGNTTTRSNESLIGSGYDNDIVDSHQTSIVGGKNNLISGETSSSIVGGKDNIILRGATKDYNIIGGGDGNLITNTTKSAIVAGENNIVTASTSTILGSGTKNKIINSDRAALMAGSGNTINVSLDSSLVSGTHNIVDDSDRALLGAGLMNSIVGASNMSSLVSGELNVVTASTHSILGSGIKNKIINSNRAALMAGSGNTINLSNNSFVGSGEINLIDKSKDSSIVGGDNNLISGETSSSIVGGWHNSIHGDAFVGEYNFIGGGVSNEVISDTSIIGAGKENTITRSLMSLIGSGFQNDISHSQHSSIVGGVWNSVRGQNLSSFIGGGLTNTIGQFAAPGGENNVIGGGAYNVITQMCAQDTIVGGMSNSINEQCGWVFIGGGQSNRVGDGTWIGSWNTNWSSIVGGKDNYINYEWNSVIAGGESNLITGGTHNIIGGGEHNIIKSQDTILSGVTADSTTHSIIGAGTDNLIVGSDNSFIGSGHQNQIHNSDYTIIGAGQLNVVKEASTHSVIAGGRDNDIYQVSPYSVIGGGIDNDIFSGSPYSVIVGGDNNKTRWSNHSFIGNGAINENRESSYSVVVGGYWNRNYYSKYSFIGGGSGHTINTRANYGTIGGGAFNRISRDTPYATIAGGYHGFIDCLSPYSIIGGGERNTILSAATHTGIFNGSGNTISANTIATAIIGSVNRVGYVTETTFTRGIDANTDGYDGVNRPFRYHGGWASQGFGRILTDMTGLGDAVWMNAGVYQICDDVCPIVSAWTSDSGCTINFMDCTGTTTTADTCCTITGPYAWRGGIDSITTTLPLVGQAKENKIRGSAKYSTIQGGLSNLIGPSVEFSSILNGSGNTIFSGANYSAIVGSKGRTAVTPETTYVTGLDALTDGNDGLAKPFRYHGAFASNGTTGWVLEAANALGDAVWAPGPGLPEVPSGCTITGITTVGCISTFHVVGGPQCTGTTLTANTCDGSYSPYRPAGGTNSITTTLHPPSPQENVIDISSNYSTISAGWKNQITSGSSWSNVLGGIHNRIHKAEQSVILAGIDNYINFNNSGFTNGVIINGSGNTVNHSHSVIMGGDGIITDRISTVFMNGLDVNTNSTVSGLTQQPFKYHGAFASHGNSGDVLTSVDALGNAQWKPNIVYPDDPYCPVVSAFTTNSGCTLHLINCSGDTFTAFTCNQFGSYSPYEIGAGLDAIQPILPSGPLFKNLANGLYTNIGGGLRNIITTPVQTSNIAGGAYNEIVDNTLAALIGGGQSNRIHASSYSSIVGGVRNIVKQTSTYSTIVGGFDNLIVSGSAESFIGGGRENKIAAAHTAFIGGGDNNTIVPASSVSIGDIIVGGLDNAITSTQGYATIVGGRNNAISGYHTSFIGGGEYNQVFTSASSAIVGGSSNYIKATQFYNFIGGGLTNVIGDVNIAPQMANNVIVGGESNLITDIPYQPGFSSDNFIGGGTSNKITGSTGSIIVGGNQNKLYGDTTIGPYGPIGTYSIIGGGQSNKIGMAEGSMIGAGYGNEIRLEEHAFIGGGSNNTITGPASWKAFIGAGAGNKIDTNQRYSSIVGGMNNLITQHSVAVSGGTHGWNSILGGDGNIISGTSYSSIVNGKNNIIKEDPAGGFALDSSAIIGGSNIVADRDNTTFMEGLDVETNLNTFTRPFRYHGAFASEGTPGHVLTSFNGAGDAYWAPIPGGPITLYSGCPIMSAYTTNSGCILNLVDCSGRTFTASTCGTFGALSPYEYRANASISTVIPNTSVASVNFISINQTYSNIQGGSRNSINSYGAGHNAVGGGWSNAIGGDNNSGRTSGNTAYAVIAGGYDNRILGFDTRGEFIGAGKDNEIRTGNQSSILGGEHNLIKDSRRASILGGQDNTIIAVLGVGNGNYSSIVNGQDNTINFNSSAIIGADNITADMSHTTFMNGLNIASASAGGNRFLRYWGGASNAGTIGDVLTSVDTLGNAVWMTPCCLSGGTSSTGTTFDKYCSTDDYTVNVPIAHTHGIGGPSGACGVVINIWDEDGYKVDGEVRELNAFQVEVTLSETQNYVKVVII